MCSSIDLSKTVHVGRWPHVCSIVKKETSTISSFRALFISLRNNVGLTAPHTRWYEGGELALGSVISDQSEYGR